MEGWKGRESAGDWAVELGAREEREREERERAKQGVLTPTQDGKRPSVISFPGAPHSNTEGNSFPRPRPHGVVVGMVVVVVGSSRQEVSDWSSGFNEHRVQRTPRLPAVGAEPAAAVQHHGAPRLPES